MIPMWALRVLPYAGGALVLLGALWWAHERGVSSERVRWQAAAVVAERAARQREGALQAQVDAAGVALSEMSARISDVSKTAITNTRTFYVSQPGLNRECLAPQRVQHIQASDAALALASPAK